MLGDGIVLDGGGFPDRIDRGIGADAELRHEVGEDAEEAGVVVKVVLDEIVEAVGAERSPRARDGDDEIAARGGKFHLVLVGRFFFQQRGVEESAIVGRARGGGRCRLFRRRALRAGTLGRGAAFAHLNLRDAAKNARAILTAVLAALFAFLPRLRGFIFDFSPICLGVQAGSKPAPFENRKGCSTRLVLGWI